MWPMAYAIVSTVRPNARDTPSRPMPTFGNAAASTALPQPPKTSQKVPSASAARRFPSDMTSSFDARDETLAAVTGLCGRGWARNWTLVQCLWVKRLAIQDHDEALHPRRIDRTKGESDAENDRDRSRHRGAGSRRRVARPCEGRKEGRTPRRDRQLRGRLGRRRHRLLVGQRHA